LIVILSTFLSAGTTFGVVGDVWDAGADYSDVVNPNGPWSYRHASDSSLLLATTQVWDCCPDAWSSDGTMGGTWYFDPVAQFTAQSVDDYVTSGNLDLRWTSPVTGTIDITGSIWGIWGATSWEVFLNDVSLGNGAASGGGATAAADHRTPFGLQTLVVAGDIVAFHVNGGSGGEYMIEQVEASTLVNLTVIVDPVQVTTVTPSAGVQAYGTGSSVPLTASTFNNCPTEAYVFDHWTGNVLDSSSATTSITMNQDETVTAVFVDTTIATCSALQVWDFGDDYSGVSNPNGAWSYRKSSNDSLLLASTDPWNNSPAWSVDGTVFPVPWLFATAGTAVFGAASEDDFIQSGGVRIQWTSPITGWIQISGLIWNTGTGVGTPWSVALNSVVLVSGVTNGLAGPAAGGNPVSTLTTVIAGDIIDLDINAMTGGRYVIEQIEAPSLVNLTVQANPSQVDTITPAPGVYTHPENLVVQLTASDYFNLPTAYVFDYWQGDVADPQAAQTSVTMDQNKTVTAVFRLPPPLIEGDINLSECVTVEDLFALALRWMDFDCVSPDYCDRADINTSGEVDLEDYASIGSNWNQCYTEELHNLGFVVVAPTDGDFGWFTPGTQTSGMQEAINFAVLYRKDVYVVGGGIKSITDNGDGTFSVVGPIVYPIHATLKFPAAENFRFVGGNYVMHADVLGDMVVIDSQKNSELHFGLLVHSPSVYGSALVKIQPQTPRPSDGQIGFVNSTFDTVGVVGEGAVSLESNLSDPKGIGLQLDASAGPIAFSQFHITEVNACEKGIFLEQGDIRNNVFEAIFNHLTVKPIEVNSGSYNRFYSLLDITGVIPSAIGADISGGSQNVFELIFNNGFGSGNGVVFGTDAQDNLIYATGLALTDIVNNATVSTNRIVPFKPVGFSVATPAFPGSGTFLENRTSFAVVATIKSAGQVSSWTLKDGNGLSQTITSGLYKQQSIYLEPGEMVSFTYSSTPSWSWRALR